jgi:hypothetical protein
MLTLTSALLAAGMNKPIVAAASTAAKIIDLILISSLLLSALSFLVMTCTVPNG